MDAKTHAIIKDLMRFIDLCPTPYHVTEQITNKLQTFQFTPYDTQEQLKPGDRRFLIKDGSALFAFSIGRQPLSSGFKLIGSHTDGPGLKIKPQSLLEQDGHLCLNTEIYGGPILHTWFDRPLSLAGQIAVKGKNPWQPEIKLVDFKRPVLIIPSLAIHMDRDVNNSNPINKTKALLPVMALSSNMKLLSEEKPIRFETILARQAGVTEEDILDYALFLYDVQPACLAGLHEEFISAPRLDNLGMVHASVNALTTNFDHTGIHLIACFDHEEIGSRSRQGAYSATLRDLMEQIVYSLSGSRREFLAMLEQSYLISADQAHALHPNFKEAADQTNRPLINGGPVLKTSASQSYITDARAMAIFKGICQQAGVPCQSFANRSDQRGGSTTGPLTVERTPVRGVDVGNPIWAMHAIRETGGSADQAAMIRVMESFFSDEIGD